MDEAKKIEDFMKPKCPVDPGDRFYRKHKTMTIPDRLEVLEVIPHPCGYFIKARYMYHAIGILERTFSDMIFKDENWVIEKRGIDFAV
mgnify:CR=1 FL=1